MSLKKKDPSMRVAANDPHLVSLGGGRLSTAVTIHYIPIGDTTIGCSTTCSISLNGTGVRPVHCTIYRSEENEVTIVPEQDARILIDGTKITHETNLTQGAMITIGNSNYLRFNNPAEAQMMRSAMGSNERISMPQIDFTQEPSQQRNSTKSIGTASSNCSTSAADLLRQSIDLEAFYESKINPLTAENPCASGDVFDKANSYNNMLPIDINGLQCPKVFTADLVTVNMPAKDVLGQKYANFARNLAENHRNVDKNVNNALRINQMTNLRSVSAASSVAASSGSAVFNGSSNYVNIPTPTNYIQNTSTSGGSTEYLTKVNNVNHPMRANNTNAYDRYPKPGSYGGLQIYPMNGVNTEINNCSATNSPKQHQKSNNYEAGASSHPQQRNQSHISSAEHECLEDMLKICTEYADRQHQHQSQNHSQSNSITSSPIVQNRIKTNGSLPRDKKSPFHQQHDLSGSSTQLQLAGSFSNSSSNLSAATVQSKLLNNSSNSSGYENVRLLSQNRVEINGQVLSTSTNSSASPKTGYENIAGKYVPQSPRTKIRTTCMSPKKHAEHSVFSNTFGGYQAQPQFQQLPHKPSTSRTSTKQSEYEQLIKTFEEKLQLEMQAIEESSRYKYPLSAAGASLENSPSRRSNKNINNLTLNLHNSTSLQNSPRLSKKPAPAPRNLSNAGGLSSSTSNLQRLQAVMVAATEKELDCADLDKMRAIRREVLARIERLKQDITELQKQENEALRELDLEKALIAAELNSVGDTVNSFKQQLQSLQNKIRRLEAQRNATRVMEENQQAKLKQSIEMKLDQVKKLKIMLKQKPNNDVLKEELHSVADSLENDRKTFEDLEFQYLEEESEWQAYREELHSEETALSLKIGEQRAELEHLEKQEKTNQTNASSDTKMLKQKLLKLLSELKQCQDRLKALETSISDVTGQLQVNSSDDEDYEEASVSTASPPMQIAAGVMSQSLFGSAELLCPKRASEDIMSKSVNENMFYNNKIELPSSTPKRPPPLQVVDINDAALVIPKSNVATLRLKYSDAETSTPGEASRDERVKFNLSLGSDDFEVNPLEKRVPSQDDIDRICKVTLDAPISTKGASNKIFDSIKEIERNRQLLLAQQGHHVIEHERQKMQDLKKKCHDEARAQYLSMLSCTISNSNAATNSSQSQQQRQSQEILELDRLTTANKQHPPEQAIAGKECEIAESVNVARSESNIENSSFQHRHSQPEYESHHKQQQLQQHNQRNSRPLSESNSELSCADLLSESNICKSSLELSPATSASDTGGNSRYSGEQNAIGADETAATKRSSVNSNETSCGSERKRALPKHQRPLTRYLPIFSPDLNLRHHIESAGHQIALCPHVFVDAHSCRGYLHKLGATFHGWARRWFVLDRQRNALIYFSDKSERKPRGGAYFSTIDEVYLDHLNASKSGRPHCTLIVKTKKRSYQLQAASDAAARIWIDAIITGAQGNLDY